MGRRAQFTIIFSGYVEMDLPAEDGMEASSIGSVDEAQEIIDDSFEQNISAGVTVTHKNISVDLPTFWSTGKE